MIQSFKTRKKQLIIHESDLNECETLEIISKSLETLEFQGNSKIQSLRLYCPKLKNLPKELISHQDFHEIRIKENQFINDLLPNLSDLKDLKNIYLTNVKLSTFPTFIKKSLLTLEILDISKNSIDRIPSYFANASSLKRLILDNNPLTNFDFKREDFEDLNYLSLDAIPFNEEQLSEIKREFNLI